MRTSTTAGWPFPSNSPSVIACDAGTKKSAAATVAINAIVLSRFPPLPLFEARHSMRPRPRNLPGPQRARLVPFLTRALGRATFGPPSPCGPSGLQGLGIFDGRVGARGRPTWCVWRLAPRDVFRAQKVRTDNGSGGRVGRSLGMLRKWAWHGDRLLAVAVLFGAVATQATGAGGQGSSTRFQAVEPQDVTTENVLGLSDKTVTAIVQVSGDPVTVADANAGRNLT